MTTKHEHFCDFCGVNVTDDNGIGLAWVEKTRLTCVGNSRGDMHLCVKCIDLLKPVLASLDGSLQRTNGDEE